MVHLLLVANARRSGWPSNHKKEQDPADSVVVDIQPVNVFFRREYKG